VALKQKTSPKPWARGLMVVAAFVLLAALAAISLPPGIDWHQTLRPGVLAIVQGRSPYGRELLFSAPPWLAAPLLPLAVLPEPIGRGLFFTLCLGVFAYSAVRLGARPVGLGLFLLSPPVMHSLLNANLDSLVLLGFVLPPPVGMFLLALKPQMSWAVALYWMVAAWNRGRWRALLVLVGPVAVTFGLSLIAYGFWPRDYLAIAATSRAWNASLWPGSIPIGLVLLVAAFRSRRVEPAMVASPCLSPYVLLHTWSGALAALVTRERELLAAVAGLWIVVALRMLGN
jgi:hypothetical protein